MASEETETCLYSAVGIMATTLSVPNTNGGNSRKHKRAYKRRARSREVPREELLMAILAIWQAANKKKKKRKKSLACPLFPKRDPLRHQSCATIKKLKGIDREAQATFVKTSQVPKTSSATFRCGLHLDDRRESFRSHTLSDTMSSGYFPAHGRVHSHSCPRKRDTKRLARRQCPRGTNGTQSGDMVFPGRSRPTFPLFPFSDILDKCTLLQDLMQRRGVVDVLMDEIKTSESRLVSFDANENRTRTDGDCARGVHIAFEELIRGKVRYGTLWGSTAVLHLSNSIRLSACQSLVLLPTTQR